MDWREEYKRDRAALSAWVNVRSIFPRRTKPTYADVRRLRRYMDRLGNGLLKQPATLLTTRDESVRDEIRAQFPQPRLRGLRGLIVPAQVTHEPVRARRTKRGAVLEYSRRVGSLQRRFVRIPPALLAQSDVEGVRRILNRAWREAKRDRYTAALLALKDGLDSQFDSLVQDTTGLPRLMAKVETIVKNDGGYRDSAKWFRGIHFLKETGRRREPKRAGGVKREIKAENARTRAKKKRAGNRRRVR